MKAVLVACFLSLAACSSLLYYPKKEFLYNPKQFHLDPEIVTFQNKNGQKIQGWWFNSNTKPAKGTFVFFHGNAENISSHFIALSWLPAEGYNYFIFDYPGYGNSEGEPTPYANVITGQAALRWVHQTKDSSPLIVYGQSMGGIIAMRAAFEEKGKIPMKAVIADGTFSSFQRIGRKKLAQHWLTWLFQPLSYLVLSDEWAPEVDKLSPLPLIVMHGKLDPVVEFEHGERIYADAKEPKAFIEVPQGHHGDLFWVADQKYRQVLLNELEKIK
jgi:hypothetical protein